MLLRSVHRKLVFAGKFNQFTRPDEMSAHDTNPIASSSGFFL